MEKKVKTRKKPIRKTRVAFILFAVTLPIGWWFVEYVYGNFSSFLMAFHDMNGNWTLQNFERFFKEFTTPGTEIFIAFKNTFITFGITVIMFPINVLVSYFIYKKIPGAMIYRVLFFLPGILFSVCTAMMFSRVIGVNGFIAKGVAEWLNLDYVPELLTEARFANKVVLLHMVWLGFPGNLIIWGGTFARIPVELLEAGTIDGTTWWTEFTKITVPMVWPMVALNMVLMGCGIFGASGAVFLLTRGGYGTMTLSAWQYIQLLDGAGGAGTSNVYNYMSAVGLCLSIVALILSFTIRHITDKVFNDVEF